DHGVLLGELAGARPAAPGLDYWQALDGLRWGEHSVGGGLVRAWGSVVVMQSVHGDDSSFRVEGCSYRGWSQGGAEPECEGFVAFVFAGAVAAVEVGDGPGDADDFGDAAGADRAAFECFSTMARAPRAGAQVRRSSAPGTSALSRHGVPASRCRVRSRAAATRLATRAEGSAKPVSFSSSLRPTGSSSILTSTRSSRGPEIRPRYRRRVMALQEQPSAGPATLAHGHGFAASTRVNRAGNRAVTPDRASTISPASSGCRSASRQSRPISSAIRAVTCPSTSARSGPPPASGAARRRAAATRSN